MGLDKTHSDFTHRNVRKDAAIFPKKIKGKYAILHRLGTEYLLDFVDDFEIDATNGLVVIFS